jgi:hypothetical protein
MAYISGFAYKYISMGLYKYLIIFHNRIFKHGIIIQHMEGGVGGKLGWMELCVTQFTTVAIVFKRGGA